MKVTTQTQDGKRVIRLEGHVDSGNAAQVEEEIMKAVNEIQPDDFYIDADALEYISSAGLRVLMKLRKQIGKEVTVMNVSPEVYDIFDTTGFTELLNVNKKLRTISVEGCPEIGKGGNGTVYRLDDDTIVKVYKPWMTFEEIERERNFAKTAFVNGIPSVIAYDMVKCGDCFGIVFEMLKSDTLGHQMAAHPEKLKEYVGKYVELAKTLHNTHVPANTFANIRDILRERLPKLKEWCSDEELSVLADIINSIPDCDTIIHNDLHPGNIMIQDGELVLIDMPEVTMGPPIYDLAAIFRDLISAPQAPGSVIEQSVGMPKEMIMQVGQMFFAGYIGITSPEELEVYMKKMGLLYAFNAVLVVGTGAEGAIKSAPRIMEYLLRPMVIPNAEIIKQMFREG